MFLAHFFAGVTACGLYGHQLAACIYEVLSGPGKLLRWSVPASQGHDDLLISTALTSRHDALAWQDRPARSAAVTSHVHIDDSGGRVCPFPAPPGRRPVTARHPGQPAATYLTYLI